MKTYELILIFDPNVESEQVETDLRKIQDLITNQGGMFRRWERWGKRRLAYEIRHRQYGQYILSVYDLPPAGTHELDRLLHLTTALLRHLITLVEPERVPEVDEDSVQSLGIAKEAPPEDVVDEAKTETGEDEGIVTEADIDESESIEEVFDERAE